MQWPTQTFIVFILYFGQYPEEFFSILKTFTMELLLTRSTSAPMNYVNLMAICSTTWPTLTITSTFLCLWFWPDYLLFTKWPIFDMTYVGLMTKLGHCNIFLIHIWLISNLICFICIYLQTKCPNCTGNYTKYIVTRFGSYCLIKQYKVNEGKQTSFFIVVLAQWHYNDVYMTS